MANLHERSRLVNDIGFPPPRDRAAWGVWWNQLAGLVRLAERVDPLGCPFTLEHKGDHLIRTPAQRGASE
jgi:hypothetical protein